MFRFAFMLPALLVLLVSPAAAKSGYNHFNVPVALSGLPLEANALQVTCYVSDAGGTIVAGGESAQDVTGGRFEGNFVIRIRGVAGHAGRGATGYLCRLILSATLPGGRALQFWSAAALSPGGWSEEFYRGPGALKIPRAAKTPMSMSVTGSIASADAHRIALAGLGECPCGCGEQRGSAASACTVAGLPRIAGGRRSGATPLPADPSGDPAPAAPANVSITTRGFVFRGTGAFAPL